MLLFLLSPIVVVGGVSLNEKKSLYFPPQGLSLAWYVELFTQEDWLVPIENSMVIATLSSLAALSIALPLAYFLWRYRVFYARALFMLGIAPFMLPPVITALGFLSFWATVGLYGEMAATIVSHAIFFVTLPLVTISLGLRVHRPRDRRGRRDHGGRLPGRLPHGRAPDGALLHGVGLRLLLRAQPERVHRRLHGLGFTVETLPIKIFNALRYGYTPVMASVTMFFVLLAALIFGLIGRFGDLPRLMGALTPESRNT